MADPVDPLTRRRTPTRACRLTRARRPTPSPPLDAARDVGARDAPGDAAEPDAEDTPPDSGTDGPCDLSAPFGTPTLIPGTDLDTGPLQGTPRLSPDEVSLYFWSERDDDAGVLGTHLYATSRASKAASFDPPTLLSALSSTATDASPTVSGDGLTMLFESDRLGGGNSQLFIATRAMLSGSFANPSLLANVNVSTANEATPYLRPDGAVLYFSSSRGTAGQDIYRTTLQPDGAFGAATAVIELNSPSDEYSPVITDDELDVYWGSQRTDLGSEGDFDIFHASRTTPGASFTTIESAGTGLNSSGLDLPGWISPDRCSLYLESTRGGSRQLYVARRP